MNFQVHELHFNNAIYAPVQIERRSPLDYFEVLKSIKTVKQMPSGRISKSAASKYCLTNKFQQSTCSTYL
jgi:hypothetical protein